MLLVATLSDQIALSFLLKGDMSGVRGLNFGLGGTRDYAEQAEPDTQIASSGGLRSSGRRDRFCIIASLRSRRVPSGRTGRARRAGHHGSPLAGPRSPTPPRFTRARGSTPPPGPHRPAVRPWPAPRG